MMGMYLNTASDMANILFKGWSTNSANDVVLASFLTFLFTFLFEVLKVVKTVISSKRRANPIVPCAEPNIEYETTEPQAELLSSLRIPSSLSQMKRHKMKLFALECLLHTLTFAYGYVIMLIVMTYSVWFLLAVLAGSAIGYLVCYPIGQYITRDRTPRQHCHGSSSVQTHDTDIRQWI